MSKQYELTVDLLNCKIGTILTHTGENWYETKAGASMPAEIVENNPDWFKPIEDKEPTAFKWSDELVKEFYNMNRTSLEVMSKYYMDLDSIDRWKSEYQKHKLSQSIKSGTGTANDVGFEFTKEDQQYLSKKMNEQLGTANETINEEKKWDWHKERNHTITDNPFLDRQDKKERIEVKNIYLLGTQVGEGTPLASYLFKTTKQFDPEKFPLIKRWLEWMLNADEKDTGTYLDFLVKGKDKLFTEDDLKRAFVNAHLMKGDRYVYNTFEDYKNSLK